MVLLGVIPSMLIALFFASDRADLRLKQETQENMALKAKIVANTVYWWNEMNVMTLKQVSQQSDITNMEPKQQERVLENLLKTHKNLYLASTTDLDGFNLARSDGGKLLYYGDRPWFLGARSGQEITYQSLISRTIKKPGICMGSPIRQEDTEIAGVIMLCTKLSALVKQIGELQFGNTGYALLVDHAGKVLAHPNSSFISGQELKDLSQYPPVTRLLEGRDGFFPFEDEQGVNWISYGIPLENGWNVAIIQEEAEFLQSEQEFQNVAYLVTLVAVMAVIALTSLAANHLIQPITQITTAAKAIANGQLDRRVEIESQDELGSLATSFNQMAKRLKISFKELEHRVRKRTAELNKAKETAESANQTKDKFLARISHELRSPLNSIISYATILQDRPDLIANKAKGLRIIRESGIYLLNLIEDILDFSKVKVGKIEINPKYINSNSFIDGIEGMAEMWAEEKKLAFKCQVDSDIAPRIWVDQKRLRQVLINLLNNAIKFTKQGKIILRVRLLKETEDTSAANPLPQQEIRFEVIDTGIGISPRHLQTIFQPFEQVNNVEEKVAGVGLGLAISKQIVELMGSKLQVKSQLGVGSIFWFDLTLPTSEVISEAKIIPPLPSDRHIKALNPSKSKKSKSTILVVDDQEENHLALLAILNPLGFEVISVTDGQQALDIAPSIKPDLILLDLFMPIKTGFTLVGQLRQIPRYDAIPLFLISASSYDIVKKASQHLSCQAFLTKPIDEQKLVALLKEYGLLPLSKN